MKETFCVKTNRGSINKIIIVKGEFGKEKFSSMFTMKTTHFQIALLSIKVNLHYPSFVTLKSYAR